MDKSFEISLPSNKTTGDFLSFEIAEGKNTWRGRISRTALTILDPSGHLTETEIFAANLATIRQAAYQLTRGVPSGDTVTVSSEYI